MKQLTILSLIFILFVTILQSQTSDSFDDGDFTHNPTWVGNESDFIVNTDKELQLYASEEGTSYLSTPHNLTSLENIEWRYRVKYAFSPSANNFGLTYLTATSSDLSTQPDGIFFKIGEQGSNDPIELIARNNGVEHTILTSTPGIVAQSFNIHVKIIYRPNGDWELYTDLNGGSAFQLDKVSNYPTTIVGAHLGIWLKYTVSNAKKIKYDDFYVGAIAIDTIPPSINTVDATSSTQLKVEFTEDIEQSSGEALLNYAVNHGIGNPIQILQDPVNKAWFHLTFPSSFAIGQNYILTAFNVKDNEGNTMDVESKGFKYLEAETPEYGDIIINEFIPKVSPTVGLPETQFVELYNRSEKYFNLGGWKLSDNNSSGTIREAWLFPGDYLILVPSSGTADYPEATEVSSWAILNQTGDEIHLSTDNGFIVDELTYTADWYKDENKKNGGWSIERINTKLPCSDLNNWRASNHSQGGTPGFLNSVNIEEVDTLAPAVKKIEVIDSTGIQIYFSEGMDSLSLTNIEFNATPNIDVASRTVQGKFPNQMKLVFETTITPGVLYTYTLDHFSDCSGNYNSDSGTFILPQTPEKGDLLINEILFNPHTGGSDFVEIYNHSNKYIDLLGWQLANHKDGMLANVKTVETNYVLSPNDYVVLTKDSVSQLINYPMAVPGKFIQLSTLPSYNNDSSTVYLLCKDSVMDKVPYEENWHFSLLNSTKGVSLERFSADQPSGSPSNWHSASETVGFATPGAKNSQHIQTKEGGNLSLSSPTFSPDGDGFEDVLILTYKTSTPDLIGYLTVFDDKGRKIKTLLSQHLLGNSGSVKWEGTKDDSTKASIGSYIIVFEMFNLESARISTVRKVVTLAGKL